MIVELPDEDLIEPEVGVQNETAGGVGDNLVRVSSIVSAEGEAAGLDAGGAGTTLRAELSVA